MRASIEKITLKIGDKTFDLTLAEARQLWIALEEMFGAPPQVIPYPVYPTWPTWPQYPTYSGISSTGEEVPKSPVQIT